MLTISSDSIIWSVLAYTISLLEFTAASFSRNNRHGNLKFVTASIASDHWQRDIRPAEGKSLNHLRTLKNIISNRCCRDHASWTPSAAEASAPAASPSAPESPTSPRCPPADGMLTFSFSMLQPWTAQSIDRNWRRTWCKRLCCFRFRSNLMRRKLLSPAEQTFQ